MSYDGWISKLLWFDLDNLPPKAHGRVLRDDDVLRSALKHAAQENRDLRFVCRDQARHIKSLEAQLLPHLVGEIAHDQEAML